MNVLDVIQENTRLITHLPDGGHILRTEPDGSVNYYNKNQQLHRDNDLPAVRDEMHHSNEWYVNGTLHRDNGPAIQYDNGNATWYKNGEKHRVDGPAVDWKTIRRWMVNGHQITDWIQYYTKQYLIPYPFEPNKSIVAELDADKPKIIKNILEHIKAHGSADIALPIINMLKNVGVTWPELTAIEKSATSINESHQRDLMDIDFANKLITTLRNTQNSTELGDIISQVLFRKMSLAKRKRLFSRSDIEDLYIKWFSKYIQDDHISIRTLLYMLSRLVKFIKPNWPNLKSFLDNKKSSIIKDLLIQIKEGFKSKYTNPTEDLKIDINTLRYFGIDWSELTTIENSITAKNLHISQLNEMRGQQFVDHDDLLRLQTRISEPTNAYDLVDWIDSMQKSGYLYSQISNTLSDPFTAKLIKMWMDTIIKEDKTSGIEIMLHTLEMMSQYRDVHVIWEKTNIPLESNKHAIVKELLEQIKDRVNSDHVLRFVDALRYFKCEWSELDIIEKSLRHGQKQINETAMTPAQWETYKEQEQIKLVTNDPFAILNMRLKSDAVQLAAVKSNGLVVRAFLDSGITPSAIVMRTALESIAENKTKVIRFLLKIIHDSPGDVTEIKEINLDIKFLRNNGFNWPELDIIEKSINVLSTNPLNENNERGLLTPNECKLILDKFFRYLNNTNDNEIERIKGRIGYWLEKILGVVRNNPNTVPQAYLDEKLLLSKKRIVTHILRDINDTGDFFLAYFLIKELRELKQEWPEFTIIEKSGEASKSKLKESNDVHTLSDLYDVTWRIDKQKHLGTLYDLLRNVTIIMGLSNITQSQLSNAMDSVKDNILRIILADMKSNKDWTLDRMAIDILRELKLLWPELSVIEKSIQAELQQLNESKYGAYSPYDDNEPTDIEFWIRCIKKYPADCVRYLQKIQTLGIPQERIDSELLSVKSIILKEVLEETKRTGYFFFADLAVNILRHLNQHWPELNVLQNSVRHELGYNTKLDEVEAAPYYYMLDNTVREFRGGDIELAGDWVTQCVKNYRIPTKMVVRKLTRIKHIIIKRLLDILVSNSQQYALDLVNHVVKSLKEVGIDWPELIIVEKSVNTEKARINESVNFDPEKYRTTFDLIRRYIKDNAFDSAFLFLNHKLKFSNLPLEAVSYVLNLYKHEIIKYFLMKVSSGERHYISEVKRFIMQLRKLSIDWSELDTIEKSINAELKKLINESREYDITDLYNVVWEIPKLRNNLYNSLRKIEIIMKSSDIKQSSLEKAMLTVKGDILKTLLTGMKTNKDWTFERLIIEFLRDFYLNWPELDIIEKSMQAELKRLNEAYYDDHMPPGITDSFKQIKSGYVKMGVDGLLSRLRFHHQIDPAFINEKLLELKPIIVKWLLEEMKELHFSVVETNIDYLRMLNQTWPELDIIEKSLHHKVNEDRLDWIVKTSSSNKGFDEIANKGNVYIGLMMICTRLENGILDQTMVNEKLSELKPIIMKYLLSNMRNLSFIAIKDCLYVLYELKQRWPELTIVKRSMREIENSGKYINDIN